MSTDTIMAFLHQLKTDRELRRKAHAIDRVDPADAIAAVIGLAESEGYSFSVVDYVNLVKGQVAERHRRAGVEVDEAELNARAGAAAGKPMLVAWALTEKEHHH
ncbi:hypothetical protein Pan216_58240 [Planctomycetes bacterium Pan216]|uniref:Nif11 domain-containing protein n=1 Tax=Kolteria novifilia TaxID=2527975 RepID=A0A518BD73_9BACT|nr:hypothetical protein Pan216_58240 [Planctomycetes bacterium Pan216]